jgi:hypothetical protein
MARRLGDHVQIWLEAAACSELRLMTLLLDEFTSTEGMDMAEPHAEDAQAQPVVRMPLEIAESPYMLWVDGAGSPFGPAAIAGLLSGRGRRLSEYLAARAASGVREDAEPAAEKERSS